MVFKENWINWLLQKRTWTDKPELISRNENRYRGKFISQCFIPETCVKYIQNNYLTSDTAKKQTNDVKTTM